MQLIKEENEIIELKYSGKQICKMNIDEISLVANVLFVKIHAITGWIIPENQVLAIFTEQFKLKMSESYSNCTVKEVEYAFRTYCGVVEDWGKNMNLGLIDKIMTLYLNDRLRASASEERLKSKPIEQKVMTDAQLLDWKRGITEIEYQQMRNGRRRQMSEIMKEMLVHDAFVTGSDQLVDFIVHCLNTGHPSLYEFEP